MKTKLSPQNLEVYRNILHLLAKYRFLTTAQIWQLVMPERRVQLTREYLARLNKSGMVLSFPYQPERGHSSELCWLLAKEGAGLIRVKYHSHYLRHPTRERIEFRTVELMLEKQVSVAGWDLIHPQNHNQLKPLPSRTKQYFRLASVVGEDASLAVPLNANDYVAFTQSKAVVLILCPPRATTRFWNTRIIHYRLLASRLPVVAVFETAELARSEQAVLTEAGFLVTGVELVGNGLKRFCPRPTPTLTGTGSRPAQLEANVNAGGRAELLSLSRVLGNG